MILDIQCTGEVSLQCVSACADEDYHGARSHVGRFCI